MANWITKSYAEKLVAQGKAEFGSTVTEEDGNTYQSVTRFDKQIVAWFRVKR